jgi:hypothetical protein
MNCQTFRTIVHEIDVPEGLEASALDAALGHAQDCSRCARQLHQARELTVSLQALARADRNLQAPAYSEVRLLEAFRAQRGRRRPQAWAGWMAAAAALILAAGAGLRWPPASSSARRAPERAAVSVSAPPSSPAQLPPALTAPPPSRSAPVSPSGLHAAGTGKAVAADGPAEELADFIPLPYVDQDAPLGSGEVVRIRLSEADLGLLGLPVSEDAGGRSLTADVVIGEDGVARAIRFMPSSSSSLD